MEQTWIVEDFLTNPCLICGHDKVTRSQLMSVLTIRAHKRYAMRLPVELQRADARHVRGLLIEMSLQGARISNLECRDIKPGQQVEMLAPNGKSLPGVVRWSHDGIAGIKLTQALHLPELAELVAINRKRATPGNQRFGT
jgi:hypothetical protein